MARPVKGLGNKLNSRVLRVWRRVANVELSILASCRERRVQQWQMHRKSELIDLCYKTDVQLFEMLFHYLLALCFNFSTLHSSSLRRIDSILWLFEEAV